MISEVVMPQMGADMEEGTIIRWLKQEGDAVERGEIIAEIETDKANVEIESFESGVFRKALANEGDTVDVGTIIAIVASPDEDISRYEGMTVAAKPATAQQDGSPPAATAPPVEAEPPPRPIAQERGLDLAQVQGTGPDGRIVRRDVEAAAEQPAAVAPSPTSPAPVSTEVVGMSRMRQTIARRMSQSKR